MKIIKKGILPKERMHRAKCYNCKTEIEFKEEEAVIIYDQRDGNYLSITCPVCGSNITKSI